MILFVILFLLASGTGLAGDVKLAWDPVNSSILAGYKLHYGTFPGNYDQVIDVGNVAAYTITGLAPGTYYIVCQAYGTSGETSGYSNEVSVTITNGWLPPTIKITGVLLTGNKAIYTVDWAKAKPPPHRLWKRIEEIFK